MSPSSKIWLWLQVGHTHFLTLHLEPASLKFLEITPAYNLILDLWGTSQKVFSCTSMTLHIINRTPLRKSLVERNYCGCQVAGFSTYSKITLVLVGPRVVLRYQNPIQILWTLFTNATPAHKTKQFMFHQVASI